MELIYTLITIFCLVFGFYAGYTIGNKQTFPKIPKQIVHPIQTLKENKKFKEEELKFKALEKDLEELDNYGG